VAGEDVRGLIGVLLAAVASAGWSTISAYVPFGDEPGSPETLVLLHAAGFQILLRCTGRENLTWAVYDGSCGRVGWAFSSRLARTWVSTPCPRWTR